ncbi:MAG: hypothetical protein AAFR61_13845 [Bacteroidota bacterium]
MAEHKQLHEWADAYLNGRLSPEEMVAFEKERAINPALEEEIAQLQWDRQLIAAGVREDMRALAGEALAADSGKVRWFSKPSQLYLGAVAAVLLLLLAVYLFRPAPPQNSQELYASHFDLPAAPAFRSQAQSIHPIWETALAAYRSGNMEKAAAEWISIQRDPSFTKIMEARFYAGIALMELKRPLQAMAQFEAIDPAHSLSQDRDWYLALALLQARQLSDADRQLEKIAADDLHPFQQRAARLQEQLQLLPDAP